MRNLVQFPIPTVSRIAGSTEDRRLAPERSQRPGARSEDRVGWEVRGVSRTKPKSASNLDDRAVWASSRTNPMPSIAGPGWHGLVLVAMSSERAANLSRTYLPGRVQPSRPGSTEGRRLAPERSQRPSARSEDRVGWEVRGVSRTKPKSASNLDDRIVWASSRTNPMPSRFGLSEGRRLAPERSQRPSTRSEDRTGWEVQEVSRTKPKSASNLANRAVWASSRTNPMPSRSVDQGCLGNLDRFLNRANLRVRVQGFPTPRGARQR